MGSKGLKTFFKLPREGSWACGAQGLVVPRLQEAYGPESVRKGQWCPLRAVLLPGAWGTLWSQTSHLHSEFLSDLRLDQTLGTRDLR